MPRRKIPAPLSKYNTFMQNQIRFPETWEKKNTRKRAQACAIEEPRPKVAGNARAVLFNRRSVFRVPAPGQLKSALPEETKNCIRGIE